MSDETRERLLRATEELLLSKGQASVTLRDITNLAAANVAAVAYHFGSKDELISTAYVNALNEVTQAQKARIEALPADASLEQVVTTWLSPLVLPRSHTEREINLWAMIQRGATERAPGLLDAMTSSMQPIDNVLVTRLSQLLPMVSVFEIGFRHNLIIASASALLGTNSEALSVSAEDQAAAFLKWAIGGLKA